MHEEFEDISSVTSVSAKVTARQFPKNTRSDYMSKVIKFTMPIRKSKRCTAKKNKTKSCVGKIQMNFAILGSSHSGKTSLVKRFLCDSFSDKYNPTSMDVFEEHYKVDDTDVGVSYRIFDITGSDDFPAMRQLAISSAETFVIVYAVNDRDSFEDAKKVKMEILRTKGQSDVPILLVANKCDVDKENHVISSEEGRMLAKQWGCHFAETSAKISQNIDNLFTEPMIQMLKQKYPELATLGYNYESLAIGAR
jgi:small GTP-binding protein